MYKFFWWGDTIQLITDPLELTIFWPLVGAGRERLQNLHYYYIEEQ